MTVKCPHCGKDLQVSVSKPADNGNPLRNRGYSGKPMTLAQALEFEWPMGRHKGRSLQYLLDKHPDFILWAVKTISDGKAKQAAKIVADSMEKEQEADPDPEVHTEDPSPF